MRRQQDLSALQNLDYSTFLSAFSTFKNLGTRTPNLFHSPALTSLVTFLSDPEAAPFPQGLPLENLGWVFRGPDNVLNAEMLPPSLRYLVLSFVFAPVRLRSIPLASFMHLANLEYLHLFVRSINVGFYPGGHWAQKTVASIDELLLPSLKILELDVILETTFEDVEDESSFIALVTALDPVLSLPAPLLGAFHCPSLRRLGLDFRLDQLFPMRTDHLPHRTLSLDFSPAFSRFPLLSSARIALDVLRVWEGPLPFSNSYWHFQGQISPAESDSDHCSPLPPGLECLELIGYFTPDPIPIPAGPSGSQSSRVLSRVHSGESARKRRPRAIYSTFTFDSTFDGLRLGESEAEAYLTEAYGPWRKDVLVPHFETLF